MEPQSRSALQCRTMNERRTSEKRIPTCSPRMGTTWAALAGILLFTGCSEHPGLAAYRQRDYAASLREFQGGNDPGGGVRSG